MPLMADELREDIAAAVARMTVKVGGKREVRKLPENLHDGEHVEMITTGTYSGGNGIVVLTDRRLFFLKDGMVSKRSEDFPLSKLSSVQWSTGMLMGKITVFASGNAAEITNVAKKDGKAITDAIRERLHTPAEPAAAPVPAAVDDPAAQLRKLAELRDAGLLSDDEFEAKRAAIIDRL